MNSLLDFFENKDLRLHDAAVFQDRKKHQISLGGNGNKSGNTSPLFDTHSEQMLLALMRQMFSAADEVQAIHAVLQYIGETFACERVSIFELTSQGKQANNTYTWCASQLTLKNIEPTIPYEILAFWFAMFCKEDVLSIENPEEIRERYPQAYSALHTEGIHTLLGTPIPGDDDYIGFLRIDNPGKEKVSFLVSLLRVIGFFFATLLKRRDATERLRDQNHCDSLTGALNRNAFSACFQQELHAKSCGIVYCDISGLKQVNDLYGYAAGDDLILQSYRLIRSIVEGGTAYRIAGGEFVILCPDLSQETFAQQVKVLRQSITSRKHHIAVGSAWADLSPVDLDALLKHADQDMHRDKQQYYTNHNVDRRRRRDRTAAQEGDLHPFLTSLSHQFPALAANSNKSYFCIGDYQSRCYYISDGLKEKFGFPGNVIYDFLHHLEKRIAGEGSKKMFGKTIEQILLEKQTHFNFDYAMYDRDRNIVMMRCSGLLQWDEAYHKPLTFLASAQIEQNTFLTDPITAFPTVQSALEKLGSLQDASTVLLFKLNHFGKINELKGRHVGNQLLKNISTELRTQFDDAISFYRLEGLKFMAISQDCGRPYQDIVDAIRNIVRGQYEDLAISVAESLTFIPIAYSNQKESPLDLMQNVAELMSVAEFSPVSQAITNSECYLNGLKHEIDMEFALVRDIKNHMDNFRIVVQPVVSAKTEKIVGGEVLLRWRFKGKDVSPGLFIPIIEREKIMGVVGKWVLEQTIQCCRNIAAYRPDMYLTFNVSYQQILAYDFASSIHAMLQKYGIDGKYIVAELTETHADDEPVKLKAFIEDCEKIGVRIALDDFGNGYSSLGLLLKYSAQIIKLDRSILREMVSSEGKESLVCGLVESCHKMDKRVCIEGVETENERAVAAKVGCDIIQGFLYYEPLELHDLYHELIYCHSSKG